MEVRREKMVGEGRGGERPLRSVTVPLVVSLSKPQNFMLGRKNHTHIKHTFWPNQICQPVLLLPKVHTVNTYQWPLIQK